MSECAMLSGLYFEKKKMDIIILLLEKKKVLIKLA